MACCIRILPEDVINKISAGEVVERSASIVKELVENSLDAGAKRIIVNILNGGLTSIRVSDNGSGMSPDETKLCIQRHSTSKITTDADLFSITTLGFRGEALPSIAGVSRMSIITRTRDNVSGTELIVEGGKIKSFQETGCSEGTTVTVNDIFYNTPARLKFLKSISTEMSHITRIVTELSLSYHDVSFKLTHNEKELLNLVASNTIEMRITEVFSKQLPNDLITLDTSNEFLRIQGAISKPSFSRANRNHQFIFVNNRCISSKLINHAIYQAYNKLLMVNRYPVIFLFITINPSLIDVNIHPTKREVRFINEQGIHELISRMLKDSLQDNQGMTEIHERKSERETQVKEAISRYYADNKPRTALKKEFFTPSTFSFSRKPVQKSFKESELEITPLAQINNFYILAQDTEGLVIIDQHAAHERIIYERFMKEYKSDSIQIQGLLIVYRLDVESSQYERIKFQLPLLAKLGFIMEDFGKNTFLVKAMPSILAKSDDRTILLDIIDILGDEDTAEKPSHISDTLIDKLIKKACRAAVKAYERLEYKEIEKLIDDLKRTRNPFNCPHGRPTMIKLTYDELQTRFGRTQQHPCNSTGTDCLGQD